MYLALNSASSEESFARPFLPTLVISRYIAASIAIGIAAVSIVDKVSVNTPFSNIDFLLALDRNKLYGGESKDFFLIKDIYSNRFVLKKKEPVSKDFFMLFSNI